MQIGKYLYAFNYDNNERDLCKLESKYLFNGEEANKLLFSDIEIDPDSSAYIKKRLDIQIRSEKYIDIIREIRKLNIQTEGFKVEYLVLHGDETEYDRRLKILKDIGYSIKAIPDYYNPSVIYSICFYEGIWYFGTLVKNSFDWHKHKQKPHSYSNSIGVHIAKALVNMASKGDKTLNIIDACCGVGTIMLEACYSGCQIEGSDINDKISEQAKKNLLHFNYQAEVIHSDIKDIEKQYDAAIIDLPYNILSEADDASTLNIIQSAARISKVQLIVSTVDIKHLIEISGLMLIDYCEIQKGRKASFSRRVWVCTK